MRWVLRTAVAVIAAWAVLASARAADSIDDAAGRNDLKAVQRFVAQGVSVDARSAVEGFTPLYTAALKDSLEVAKFLIDHGADVNARGLDGTSVLHAAAYGAAVRAAALLIDKGADVNAIDLKGRTPLHMAAASPFRHDAQIIEFLLAHGAKINAKDGEGDTPLHAVVGTLLDPNISEAAVDKVAEMLVAHGADDKAMNNDKQTPCDLAKALHHFGVCLSMFIHQPK